MSTVDIGLLGLFFLGIFYGYRKGFVRQSVGLVGLILSLLIAYSFSQDTAVFLQKQFPPPNESSNPLFQVMLGITSIHHFVYMAFAFIVLFFLTRFICNLLGKLLQSFAELPIISLFNHWLGACLGLAKSFVIILIAIQLIPYIPGLNWKGIVNQSVITQYMLEISPRVSEQIREIPKPPEDNKDIL